ncbi:hypothetical protein MMC30_001043 [Trapelia coarctata]|nr:hypothetical protein [Trapelia coarctata]
MLSDLSDVKESAVNTSPATKAKYHSAIDASPSFLPPLPPGTLVVEAAMKTADCPVRIQTPDDISMTYNGVIEALRAQEYPMLHDTTYLDHAGTTLYSRSLIDSYSKDMRSTLLGNPHSASSSSQLSAKRIGNVRHRILRLFNASPDAFDVVFVANATAGIKLVADCFREHTNGFWYGYHNDAHTSQVGVREVARNHKCFESDEEVNGWIAGHDGNQFEQAGDSVVGLFAYPAQSNMNGRRLPLNWCGQIRNRSKGNIKAVYTLLDAAALVSTSPLDLGVCSRAPDFTVMSFNKIFGFPDLGALIVRKASGHALQHRKYFGGGTVEMVTCVKEQWHIKKENALQDQLEDGTLPIHSIIALDSALDVHKCLFGTFEQISSHTTFLTNELYNGLGALRHHNGVPVCKIYQGDGSSYGDAKTQGPIIGLNMWNSAGAWTSNAEVGKLAAIKSIHLRSGGLCNPGGIASSLGLSPWEMKRNFSAGQRCGNENDLIGGKPTGMIRLSLGAMSTLRDVRTFLDFMREFFVEEGGKSQHVPPEITCAAEFHVEALMIYPIKSCGGWRIPYDTSWDVRPEGLAWDREWCLVHQGSRASLSQKRYPKMALVRPYLDLDNGVLRVRYVGALPPSCPSEITVPLSQDPTVFQQSISTCSSSRVCGDSIEARVYSSVTVTDFFTKAIGVPCYLARFPAQGSGPSLRHAKPHIQLSTRKNTGTVYDPSHPPQPLPRPLLFSNESPILIISRSSLNKLNETIKSKSPTGKATSAEVFRANIIVAENPAFPPGIEQPYIEDIWESVTIQRAGPQQTASSSFDILGPCRRCQMVCVDQGTGEKNEEPFVTLAKTRRREGKVYFGVHAGLVDCEGRVRVGDRVVGVRRGDD